MDNLDHQILSEKIAKYEEKLPRGNYGGAGELIRYKKLYHAAFNEAFKNKKIEGLVKEVVGNALMNIDNKAYPLKLVFDLIDFNKTQVLSHRAKIKVFRIRSYNTIGLEKVAWQKYIKQVRLALQQHDDEDADLIQDNKTAPFALSKKGIIFYNNHAKGGFQQVIGIAKTRPQVDLAKMITQHADTLSKQATLELKEWIIEDMKKQILPGIDMYIIGFDGEGNKDWKNTIIYDVLDAYLPEIATNKVEINVNGSHLNHTHINKYMNQIKREEKPRVLYKTLVNTYEKLV